MLQWQAGPFLSHIVNRLRDGLDVRDRTYRLKTYKACFIASEAVDFMVEAGLAETREEAVQLGRLLESNKQYGLWKHVCSDHEFKDEYLFFRFAEDEYNMTMKKKNKNKTKNKKNTERSTTFIGWKRATKKPATSATTKNKKNQLARRPSSGIESSSIASSTTTSTTFIGWIRTSRPIKKQLKLAATEIECSTMTFGTAMSDMGEDQTIRTIDLSSH